MTGTMVAQVIPVAISPILTRIYSPEEFGTLALYLSILAVLSVFATMRYELAIVQPKLEDDAKEILHLCIMICGIISIILLIIVAAYNYLDLGWYDNPDLGKLLYLMPVAFFLNGFILSSRYWLLRNQKYGKIAGVALTQSSGTAVGQVTSGVGKVSNGLVLGQVFGQVLAGAYMLLVSIKTDKHVFRRYSLKGTIRQARLYHEFPKYSLIGSVSDNLATQFPILFITKVFGSSVTGYFSLTFRVLNLPLVALSSAISQVFFKKVADLAITKPEQIKPLLIRIHFGLAALMLPFIAFFWVWGEATFAFVFGENWRPAGQMASIIVFAVAIRFSVSPLSTVLAIQKNVKLGTSWQILYIFSLSVTFFVFRDAPIQSLLLAFVVHEALLYILYFFLIIKGAERLSEDTKQCVA